MKLQGDDLDDGLDYAVDFSDHEVREREAGEPPAKKKKGNLHEKKKAKMEMDMAKKKNLARESPEVVADYLNEQIRRANPDLSALELAEKYFSKAHIRLTEFDQDRTLDNYSVYINGRFKNMLPEKKKKEKQSGERKFIAVVSMSALRACDVHRATKDLSGGSLKLINKNKIDVDLNLLKTTESRVLCCTPGRLAKVLHVESSPLGVEEIKIVLVDASYLDKKMQSVWDLRETVGVLGELVGGGAKLYLY